MLSEKQKLTNKKTGFSIIEVLLSISILAIGLLGTLYLFISSFEHASDSRDETVAASLAQEGVEMVTNARDNNWAKGRGAFDSILGFPAGPPSTDNLDCRTSEDSSSIICASAIDKKLYYASGFFTHTASSDATRFQRKIVIYYKDASGNIVGRASAAEAKVQSFVIWEKTVFPAEADCNAANKCTLAETVLTTENFH